MKKCILFALLGFVCYQAYGSEKLVELNTGDFVPKKAVKKIYLHFIDAFMKTEQKKKFLIGMRALAYENYIPFLAKFVVKHCIAYGLINSNGSWVDESAQAVVKAIFYPRTTKGRIPKHPPILNDFLGLPKGPLSINDYLDLFKLKEVSGLSYYGKRAHKYVHNKRLGSLSSDELPDHSWMRSAMKFDGSKTFPQQLDAYLGILKTVQKNWLPASFDEYPEIAAQIMKDSEIASKFAGASEEWFLFIKKRELYREEVLLTFLIRQAGFSWDDVQCTPVNLMDYLGNFAIGVPIYLLVRKNVFEEFNQAFEIVTEKWQ